MAAAAGLSVAGFSSVFVAIAATASVVGAREARVHGGHALTCPKVALRLEPAVLCSGLSGYMLVTTFETFWLPGQPSGRT